MKKYIFLTILLVVAGAVFWVMTSYETIIKNVVHKYGSQVVGTDVSLEGFNISLLDGEASVKEITVANPKGYKTPNFISLGGIAVKVDTNSVLSDTIVIDSIVVDKPFLSYEIISLTQNNVKEIQANIAKNTATAEKSEAKETTKTTDEQKKTSAGKKVIIKHLQIKSGEITAAMGMIDVLPTLGNMLGVKNKYALGHDIFNIKDENIVVFPNGNYITNDYLYDCSNDNIYALKSGIKIKEKDIQKAKNYSDKIISVSNNIIRHDLIEIIEKNKKSK